MTERLVVAGVTTRALALSASRAGYQVTAVDAFGDLDLRGAAEVLTLRQDSARRYSPSAAAAAAASVPADLAAYTSNFENYPDAVARLSRGRTLLGNPPAVLRRVRDPIELMRALRRRGFPTPNTRASCPSDGGAWLVKPRRSGGGHNIVPWRGGRSVPRTRYLQERIAGRPGSIVFAADGRNAVLLGLTRQLVGDARFGSTGFRYCGSLLASEEVALFPDQDRLLGTAAALAEAVTMEFGLVGLNGLDFIAREGVPYPVEVNPRFSASMELIERAHGLSMFRLHERACRGTLPVAPGPVRRAFGKAIVFARRNVTLADTGRWLASTWVADVPHPRERIGRGHPVCTVFEEAGDAAACYRGLIRRADQVYHAAESRARGAA
ncbi:MAG TPA: ATP-grasp domain-containing protein [Gemmatimonadales bacterium]